MKNACAWHADRAEITVFLHVECMVITLSSPCSLSTLTTIVTWSLELGGRGKTMRCRGSRVLYGVPEVPSNTSILTFSAISRKTKMDMIIKVMYLLLWAEHSQCGKSFRVWTVASLQLKKETKRDISYEKKELLICGECIGTIAKSIN